MSAKKRKSCKRYYVMGGLDKFEEGGGVEQQKDAPSKSDIERRLTLQKILFDRQQQNKQASISQYTPKAGDQERMNASKDAYRKEQGKFFNRLASNPHAEAFGRNIPDAAEFALDAITVGETAAALRAAKPALKAAGKYLTERAPLKNAYTPNSEAYYRGVGKTLYKAPAIQSKASIIDNIRRPVEGLKNYIFGTTPETSGQKWLADWNNHPINVAKRENYLGQIGAEKYYVGDRYISVTDLLKSSFPFNDVSKVGIKNYLDLLKDKTLPITVTSKKKMLEGGESDYISPFQHLYSTSDGSTVIIDEIEGVIGGNYSNNLNTNKNMKSKDSKKQLQIASGALKASNIATGAVVDFINEARNRTSENEQYYSLLRDPVDTDFTQNDIPIYTKFGGGFPREKAMKILRDGAVNGRPLSKGQKKFFATMAFRKAQEGTNLLTSTDVLKLMAVGGDVAVTGLPEVEGLPEHMHNRAWVEAEAGEVYKQPDGQVLKISEQGDRHEDGGEYITNVEKVLEDTSTSRHDARSKSLAVSPEVMKELFGVDVSNNLSHSEALEVVAADLNKNTSSIKAKLNKLLKTLDRTPNNKYAQNSLEFNIKELQKYPSKEEVFDTLFNHQESLKENIDMKQAKYGVKIPTAQDGLDVLYKRASAPNASKEDIRAFQEAFHADPYTKEFAQQFVSTRGAITNYGKLKGYGVDDLRQNEDGIMGRTTKKYFDYYLNRPRQKESTVPTQRTMPQMRDLTTLTIPETERYINSGNKNKETDYSEFDEPLRWSDIMAPAAAYLSADRIPAKYNPTDIHKIDPRLENVLPYLQQGQRDFNTISAVSPDSGAGNANLANVFAQKYAVDNQVRAAVVDRNLQRQGAADVYNAQASDKQSISDQLARSVFEQQQLAGIEAQRRQKLQSLDEILQRVNLNRKLNREGNLLMQLFPNFDSKGVYNGNKRYISVPRPSHNTTTQSTNADAQEKRMKQLGIVLGQLTPAERRQLLQEYGKNDRVDNKSSAHK